MIRLLETDFKKVGEQLQEPPSFVYSVLEEIIPGYVYTDSFSNSFLIGTASGIFYVIGDETNTDFNNSLLELFNNRTNKSLRFTLFSSSRKWDKAIDDLSSHELRRLSRYTFTYKGQNSSEDKVKLQNQYLLRKIDEDLIMQSDDFNSLYYEEYWGSLSNFLRNGFGYCIINNGRIICECTSIFRTQKYAEIDIITKTEFRGKGLAMATGQRFID